MSTQSDPHAIRTRLDNDVTEALVRPRRFFTRAEVSDDLRTVYKIGGRQADEFHRYRWSHDEVVRSTHGHPHDYRETAAPWFRSVLLFQPDTRLVLEAPLGFHLHVLAAWALFAFWPFSRLVHAFSMPPGYLTRPYIVYGGRGTQLGSRRPRRGWERTT